MNKTITLLFCLLLVPVTSALAQVPYVLGIWEMDPTASVLPQGFPLASETRSYDLRNDGYLVNVVTRKLSNGHPDFIQVVAKTDGKDYPQYQSAPLVELQIAGTTTKFSYSETAVDDHAVNIVAKFDGKVNNKGIRRISADGKTMTIDVVAIGANGQETPIKLVFRKVGG